MERCSMLPYRFNEEEILKNLREIYRLTNTLWPEKIIVCEDIFDKRFQETAMARATASASAMVSASASAIASAIASASARARAIASAIASAIANARAIASAIDWDFDYFISAMEVDFEENTKYREIMEYALRAKEAGLGYMNDSTDGKELFLAPNPVVRMNGNLFHSDSLPAIEWKTIKEYYLNDVKFPKELWERVVSGSMPFQEILQIEDIDQRTQAMRYGNVDEFIKHAKGNLLDSYIKIAANGKEVLYKLYKIPAGDIFLKDAYYAVYQCPSTDRVYMSGVEPCKTVAEAMSWKHWMKPSEWKRLIPLRTES